MGGMINKHLAQFFGNISHATTLPPINMARQLERSPQVRSQHLASSQLENVEENVNIHDMTAPLLGPPSLYSFALFFFFFLLYII